MTGPHPESSSRRPLRICIVSPFAFGPLTGGWGGGVEHQTSQLSRWLAARGHNVTMVTMDEGQPDGVEIDGVRVLKMCAQNDGVPGLRFVHPRWTSLVASLSRAGSDVYYQNCAEYVTGQVALWCRLHGKPFVYSIASDPDCDANLPAMRTLRERVLYRYGVRHADRIIVQTRRQLDMLLEGFGRRSTVLPMPVPGPAQLERARTAFPDGEFRVLWVGRFSPEKRLELLLDCAAELPGVKFDVVGRPNRDDDDYTRALYSRARQLPNVILHGMIPHEDIGEFYRVAALLCNTSVYEGFPNTFIEAWSYGVPVLAGVDPDGLIGTRGLGLVAKEREGLIKGIESFRLDSQMWRGCSNQSRRYFEIHHAMDAGAVRFERVFAEVAAGHPVG